jgi:hypothetical protein
VAGLDSRYLPLVRELTVQWYEGLGVVASIATIIGLPPTFWRVVRTGQVVAETERRINVQQLLTLLPALRIAELGLDRATAAIDRNQAVDHIVAFRTAANRLRGLLADDPGHRDLSRQLQEAVASASQTAMILADLKTPTGTTSRRRLVRSAPQ